MNGDAPLVEPPWRWGEEQERDPDAAGDDDVEFYDDVDRYEDDLLVEWSQHFGAVEEDDQALPPLVEPHAPAVAPDLTHPAA